MVLPATFLVAGAADLVAGGAAIPGSGNATGAGIQATLSFGGLPSCGAKAKCTGPSLSGDVGWFASYSTDEDAFDSSAPMTAAAKKGRSSPPK